MLYNQKFGHGFVAALLCGLATMVCGGGETPTGTDTTDLAQCKIETGFPAGTTLFRVRSLDSLQRTL